MTKKKATVSTTGPTEENMRDGGTRASNTDLEHILTAPKSQSSTVCGSMESA